MCNTTIVRECDYTGRDFGASYPDSCCIDGYLWDLDSCDEAGGSLSMGGDKPCPKCNTLEYLLDEKEEAETCAYAGTLHTMITGEQMWLSALKKAESQNPAGTLAALREIGVVNTLVPADNEYGYTVQRYIYPSDSCE